MRQTLGRLKKLALYGQAVAYPLLGANHFINPDFYSVMFPPWLADYAFELNLLAGIAEIVLGLNLFLPQFRALAAKGIILMLIAFLPVHVYMIQAGGCLSPMVCLPLWLAWVRLVVMHPILMLSAWRVKDT
jgi:uncharacterized membrane protein